MPFVINRRSIRLQKQIFLMAFIVVASVAVLWVFIYNPAKNEMRRLRTELSVFQTEVNKIKRVAGGEKNLDISYKKFYKKYVNLEERLPTDERSALSALSSEANKMKIEVLLIKPEKARKCSLPIDIKEREVKEMPISMNIRCGYMKLGEYLNILREKLPMLMSVDRVDIARSKEKDAAYLDIWLKLTLYMLSK